MNQIHSPKTPNVRLATCVRQALTDGPDHVMRPDGVPGDWPPLRASFANMPKRIILIRNDGWSLGVPSYMVNAALEHYVDWVPPTGGTWILFLPAGETEPRLMTEWDEYKADLDRKEAENAKERSHGAT